MPVLLRLALAWLPFYALWALFSLAYAGAGVAEALRGSAVTIGVAAALGVVVWRATDRFPWPDRVRPSFYVLHAALATAYSVAWFLIGSLVGSALSGQVPELDVWNWENAGWRFLMGLWLYGLVAGVSYALRIRDRLREQERAAARLETLATSARLDSLHARLNPHFLFNALNSVTALIGDEPRRAEDAVERLADLLRYSLADTTGPVTLRDEWSFAEAYLEMESLRLGERLSVSTAIDRAALDVRLPPFSLQTLVENAVRHGVAPQPEGGTIRVEVSVQASSLRVGVRDDGGGSDPPAVAASAGTGLRNLRERLRGTYGDRARLDVVTAPGAGFEAVLTLPIDPSTTPAER